MNLIGAEIRNFYNYTEQISSTHKKYSAELTKIPHYQRPFRWGKDQIDQLILDWHEEHLKNVNDDTEKEKNYFAGTIVTVVDNKNKVHQLIDGQQRITTLYLIKYISLLLKRVIMKQMAYKGRFPRIKEIGIPYLEDLKVLFTDNNNSFKQIETKINYIFDEYVSLIEENKLDDENSLNTLKKETYKLLMLPDSSLESNAEKYEQEYLRKKNILFDKILGSPKLSYDRSTYVESLKDALIHCTIIAGQNVEPKIITSELYAAEEEISDNIKVYLDALDAAFTTFNYIYLKHYASKVESDSQPQDVLDRLYILKVLVDSFIEEVKFCVVQTGDLDDAYVLFEVLNDRALALDDLELVKNIFYRNYVSDQKTKPSSRIDAVIQSVDEQWVDKIFAGEGGGRSKLIAFLAISYITGDSRLNPKDSKGFRHSIREYLSAKELNSKELKDYFNIFEIARIFLESFEVKLAGYNQQALRSELSSNFSSTHKTINLLIALRMDGVLAGLFNTIIHKFRFLISNKNNEFNPSDYKEKLEKLARNGNEFVDLDEQAFNIWRSALSYDGYNKVKEAVDRLIQTYNYAASANQTTKVEALSEHPELLSNWLRYWSYANSSNTEKFKLKILLTRLFQFNIKLRNPVSLEFDISVRDAMSRLTDYKAEELELDHLEPQNKSAGSGSDSYFNDEQRDIIVNEIGNIMLLLKEENSKKGNKPLAYYLQNSEIKNYDLLNITRELFEENNTKGISLDEAKEDDVPVAPTKEFFDKREKLLISLFTKIIDIDPFKSN